VVLTSEQVRYGSVIYRRGSPLVQFRFEVDVRERVTVTEILDFRAP
jgi:FlaA1/EpsC-like NDP-sugar epimerase